MSINLLLLTEGAFYDGLLCFFASDFNVKHETVAISAIHAGFLVHAAFFAMNCAFNCSYGITFGAVSILFHDLAADRAFVNLGIWFTRFTRLFFGATNA